MATGQSLSVSATTINFEPGAAVESHDVSLTSVNSLTFASTGVPYLGSVSIHDGCSLGTTLCRRPIHHRTRLGHVWLRAWRYDYHLERGHSVQWHPNATYTVAAIVGDNLYLDSMYNSQFTTYLQPNLSKTFTDVTVQCSGFTPQLQAVDDDPGRYRPGEHDLRRNFRGPGFTRPIVVLNAATAGGNITLQDLPPAGTDVGLRDPECRHWDDSAGREWLDRACAAYGCGPNGINLTASAVDLTATGSNSEIGYSFGRVTFRSRPRAECRARA